MEAREDQALPDAFDRLSHELAEVRASRRRLVLAADADRRRTERDLHDGVQQQLIALAVDLQLLEALVDADPAGARTLLEELGRDVQQALEETAQLAHRIYPQLVGAGGLRAALRSAAAAARVPVQVEVAASGTYSPEVIGTVYACFLGLLGHASAAGERVTATVREEDGALAFVFAFAREGAAPELDLVGLRDRVEALGGRLTYDPEAGRGSLVAGLLPF